MMIMVAEILKGAVKKNSTQRRRRKVKEERENSSVLCFSWVKVKLAKWLLLIS